MTNSEKKTKFSIQPDTWMAAAFAAVLLAGLLARALVTLIPPVAVGDDGAYYLIQVRAILRDGALAIPDFPLLFYVQAGVARLLSFMMEQNTAIVTAVRINDTFLPLTLAVPVFLFAHAFVRSGDCRLHGTFAVVLVGLLAVASGNSLLMAGGMIKNSVALPCSFFFVYFLYRWLCKGRADTLAWAGVWFVLASLTHMSGFVLSMVFAATALALGITSSAVRPRVFLPGGLLLVCLAGCWAVVFMLDTARALRLVNAFFVPSWLFEGSPFLLLLHGFLDEAFRALFASMELWIGIVLGGFGVYVLYWNRARMEAPARVILVAATLVTFAFSLPIFRPEVNQRLAMIAYVPGMIPAIYLGCRKRNSAAVIAPLVLVAMLHGALAVKTLRLTALVPAAYEELVQYRTAVPPGRVIVITRQMLRWWVAWTMETHFSTRVESALDARDAYDAVLVLDEKRSGAFGLAPAPAGIGWLGAGVRDGVLLRSEVVHTLAEGEYFRLSAVEDDTARVVIKK